MNLPPVQTSPAVRTLEDQLAAMTKERDRWRARFHHLAKEIQATVLNACRVHD